MQIAKEKDDGLVAAAEKVAGSITANEEALLNTAEEEDVLVVGGEGAAKIAIQEEGLHFTAQKERNRVDAEEAAQIEMVQHPCGG